MIDPGDDPKKIIAELEKAKIQVKFLFHTHGHLDHIGATRVVKNSLSADPKIALHVEDEPLYMNLKMQGRLFGIEYEDPLKVDHYLQDEEELRVGELRFSVLHTPGHSPGSVSIRLHEDSALKIPEKLFTGDTLFKGSVGRTDLWGGDQELMFKSIHNRILRLDDDIPICPGHGPDSRIGIEKRENPFLQ